MTGDDAARLLAEHVCGLRDTRAELADVTSERDTLRELLSVTLERLATQTARGDRQAQTIVRLHEMLREQRRREEPAA